MKEMFDFVFIAFRSTYTVFACVHSLLIVLSNQNYMSPFNKQHVHLFQINFRTYSHSFTCKSDSDYYLDIYLF